MLTHLEPQAPKKKGNGKKNAGLFGGGERSAAGAAAPLSYGEERTAVRQGHGQGAPGRIIYLCIYIYIYILKTKTSQNYHL